MTNHGLLWGGMDILKHHKNYGITHVALECMHVILMMAEDNMNTRSMGNGLFLDVVCFIQIFMIECILLFVLFLTVCMDMLICFVVLWFLSWIYFYFYFIPHLFFMFPFEFHALGPWENILGVRKTMDIYVRSEWDRKKFWPKWGPACK